uniref:Neur_chan_LBD domain-containing protein n=1 Tax=Syphacia muris TaxID=451379 RepID=A0A158R5V5_9BILA
MILAFITSLLTQEVDQINVEQYESLEDCLFQELVDRFEQATGNSRALYTEPPVVDMDPITISIDYIAIRHVELMGQTSTQFSIHGEMRLLWTDPRLKFDGKEWKMDSFILHEDHHIWSPKLVDESYTGICKAADGCWNERHRTTLISDGTVVAVYSFRYPSYCVVDYLRFPEEKNNCCLFFSAEDDPHYIKFEITTKSKTVLDRTVPIKPNDVYAMSHENSAWTVEGRTIDTVKVGGFRPELLRICVHAVKKMGTLRTAIRFPITIATMVMLVSPLFGDLRTQIFVKLFTLFLQTISFIYLCAMAPTLFVLTWISMILSLLALALCRIRRTVPPSHKIFLVAKMINRVVCCVDPDPSIPYQRNFDDTPSQRNVDSPGPDYTIEWQHIYIAANNLFSFIAFIVFVFIAILEIF